MTVLDYVTKIISLDENEKELLLTLFKTKTYRKGTFFLAEGKVCNELGFVEKGLLSYFINKEGEEKTYAFAQDDGFVCNYESFVPRTPSGQNIKALENCQISIISYADLQVFYSKIDQGERFGRECKINCVKS